MSTLYENAKRVALGLVREQKEKAGDDLWNINLDDDFDTTGELSFQFFERGFDTPEELVLEKQALILYRNEYDADLDDAEKRLEILKQALESSDSSALKAVLTEVHPEEWLSLIFLDGQQLKEELVPLLEKTTPECKKIFTAAADKALKRLVNFKDLLESLKMCCNEA